MIDSTTPKALLVKQSSTGAGALFGRIQRVSLSLTIIFAIFSNAPTRAAEQSKSTQYYRAQALQNIAAGREEEALDSYKAAIKAATAQYGKDSTYLSELYFEMGNLARSNGQSEIAKSYYQNAVTYRPNDIPARLQLADLERNTKNIREAFEDSKAAFKLNQNSPIARKGLMLCLQQSGRPAEAAQIAVTLHRSGKASKLPTNIPQPETLPASNESARAKTSAPASAPASTTPPASEGGPVVTAAVSTPSPLHWAPNLKKKIDEAQAKKARDEHAAEAAAKKKQEDEQKAENDKRAKEQHRKEESEKKSKQKSKKEEAQKKKDDSAKKASKTKPAFVEPESNTASLKTTAKTISPSKSDEKSAAKSDKSDKSDKADKTEKSEKAAPKSHLGVGAVTEKQEKPAEEKHESSVSENEPAKPTIPKSEKVSIPSYQAQQSIPISLPPIEKKVKGPRRSGMLVPPPPPTPVFGGYPPPPGMMPAPAPAVVPKPRPPKPKPVVKEAAKETPKDSSDEGSPSPKGVSDDPDFLIDWGGGAKKKHGK
jgi:hypothetical protein